MTKCTCAAHECENCRERRIAKAKPYPSLAKASIALGRYLNAPAPKLPKTYRMSSWRYREGATWGTTMKGQRVTFRLGRIISSKTVQRKSCVTTELIVEVLPL